MSYLFIAILACRGNKKEAIGISRGLERNVLKKPI
jgi:hypothetical protein